MAIIPITATDIRFEPGPWPLPTALRDDVAASWARVKARTPDAWDGRILGLLDLSIGTDGVLRARAREDAYSAFLAWREAGWPDIGVTHAFGCGWIVTSDGAVILGVMNSGTVNAGRVYPPGGSIEPRDIDQDGKVDTDFCITQELLEETGLRASDARKGNLYAVLTGSRLCLLRVFYFDASAQDLIAKICANLAAQEHRELADVVACRSVDDGRAAGNLADYAEEILTAFFAGNL